MSIQEFANLAEVLGVIGVLVSLIYVARQLQQNTVQLKLTASNDQLQVFLQFWFRLANDREFATLWQKGAEDFSTLDDVDQLRIAAFETAGLTVWSSFFNQHQEELLPDHAWQSQVHDIKTLGQRESVKAAWALNQARFGQSFQQFMSQSLK